MRKIILAETAGFCFGVDRAVRMVEELLDDGRRVCTLGEIIHNSQLVSELAARGASITSSVGEADSTAVLVIPSHGVGLDVYENAKKRGLTVADATCPFVEKIHRIVKRESDDGRIVFVAGNSGHQEVKGIVGHISGESFVFGSDEELEIFDKKHSDLREKPVSLVAQTTFNADLWKKIQEISKKLYTNIKIFDTICSATANRQCEAKKLAKQCETMIVIGGRHSSNTVKLKDVCAGLCEKTFHIETVKELSPVMLSGTGDIGVVAGASTPACIIKEVLKQMSENLFNAEQTEEQVTSVNSEAPAEPETEAVPEKKSFEEMTFEEALEASLNGMNSDQKVKGTVLAVTPTEIQVDIGRKQTGYVPAAEYSNDPSANMAAEVHVGDVLDLILMKTNDQEGTVLLSKRRFDAIASWDKVVAAKESGEVLEGNVVDVIKGGVIVLADGIRVFVPASQTGIGRNEELEVLRGQTVSFRIIDIGRRRQAIGSIKSVAREQRREQAEKFWESVAVGDRFTGVVKSVTGYGAFVDLGGVDGMVHISEMSWARIKNPTEVMNVGDTVEVYVKALDPEKKKVSLGYRKAEDNPFVKFLSQYSVGDVVTVKIISLTSYGAFARIIPGVDGLIHISQIADHRIEKPADVLTVGQEVEAKIINIDTERKRISLSIRALIPEAPAAVEPDEVVFSTEESAPAEAPAEEPAEETAAVEAPVEAAAEAPAAEEIPVETSVEEVGAPEGEPVEAIVEEKTTETAAEAESTESADAEKPESDGE